MRGLRLLQYAGVLRWPAQVGGQRASHLPAGRAAVADAVSRCLTVIRGPSLVAQGSRDRSRSRSVRTFQENPPSKNSAKPDHPTADPVTLALVQGHIAHMRAHSVLGEVRQVFDSFDRVIELVSRADHVAPSSTTPESPPQVSSLDVLAAGEPTWDILLAAAKAGSTSTGTLDGGWGLGVSAMEALFGQCGLVPKTPVVVKLAHGVADAGARLVLASDNDSEVEAQAGRMVQRVLDIGEACGIPPEEFN